MRRILLKKYNHEELTDIILDSGRVWVNHPVVLHNGDVLYSLKYTIPKKNFVPYQLKIPFDYKVGI